MDLDPSVVWDFAGTLVGTLRERPRQLPATVSRVDPDGTVWLSMPGADGLVPASTTADVGADDAVTVEWWGNAYHVTGNRTSPSVGTRAAAALRRATAAAAKVAGEAKGIADAVGQHFWADDNGVHVSNEDGNATGERNILMNSLGILLRQGSAWLASFSDSAVAFYDGLGNEAANIVAQFGADGAVIGRANESHQVLDYHSLQLVDKEGNAYLYVSDLRGPDGSMLVEWESELTYVQALSTASMDLLLPPTTYQTPIITENIVSVVAHTPSGDVDITNYVNASSSSASELVFTSLPTLGTFTRATATATYYTSDRRVKALTYGSRKTPEDIGVCSSVLGWENDASGLFSHAHGNGCVASGVASNAEGGETEAVADYSHAEGRSSGTGKYAYCGHAEGCDTHANAHSAHSEGYRTTASGEHAHAEGIDSTASGNSSHAEGNNTSATKPYAHAEGRATQATFDEAHAQNLGTIAAKKAQTAIGTFNVEDTSSGTTHPSGDSNAGKYALIVGNGTADDARSNAFAVGWDGTIETARDRDTTTWADALSSKSSDVNITGFKLAQRGQVASLWIRFQRTTATSAGAAITVGTLSTAYRPLVEAAAPATTGAGDAYVLESGSVMYRPQSQLAANTNAYVRVTYLVA